MSVPQTSTIAFALIVGFIVFVTVKGQLPAYLAVIGLEQNAAVSPASQTGASQTGTSQAPVQSVSSNLPALTSLPDLVAI